MCFQMGENKNSNLASLGDIEDLIHNFLIIMLEHSMRQKDGWKVGVYPSFSYNYMTLFPVGRWALWSLVLTSGI